MFDGNESVQVIPEGVSQLSVNQFMAKVYGWMFMGLIITALSGLTFVYLLSTNEFVHSIATARFAYLGFIGAELALVFVLTGAILKLRPAVAALLFILYAAVNGVTLSYITLMYAGTTVVLAFAMTAIIFGLMSVYGLVTKSDLTSFGKLARVALVGLILVSVVNMFVGSSGMEFIICIVGLFIFIGLVAYDSQKIKGQYYQYAATAGEGAASKMAIIGALSLYLDFINIFIFILRLLGGRK